MIFEELLEEVYTLTNRPDLVAETKSAIKAATLKAHQSDYYSKDIHETGIQFDVSNYRQSLDYISLISNFRSIKYLRRVTDENDSAGTFINIITPDELLDSYGVGQTDIAYVAGRVLEIRSSVEFKYALLGAYVLPVVREGAYGSWVADMQPYAIVFEAARVVFKAIADDAKSASFERLVGEQYALLRMTGLADQGY